MLARDAKNWSWGSLSLPSPDSTCHAPWSNISCVSLPALKIHSRYPFSSRSICCCLRSFRKARRFSTLSRSLANSLQREKNKKAHHIKSGKIRRPYFAIEIVFTKPVKSIAAGTTAHYTLLPSKVLLCFYLSSFSAPHPAGGLQSPK